MYTFINNMNDHNTFNISSKCHRNFFCSKCLCSSNLNGQLENKHHFKT